MNGTLSFYECSFSGGDTMRCWGHSNPILCKRICLNFLQKQKLQAQVFAPRREHLHNLSSHSSRSETRATWWNFHYLIFHFVKNSDDPYYRPQRSWGKVIFSEACVHILSTGGSMRGCSGGGVHGCSPGGHVWLLLGGHAWLLRGVCMVALRGACMVAQGGVHGCSRRACVVAPQGVCMVAPRGACMVAPRGHLVAPRGVRCCSGRVRGCSQRVHGCSQEGMCGCSGGVCMVARGGMHGCSGGEGACVVAPGGACMGYNEIWRYGQ